MSGSVGIGFDRLIFEGILLWEFTVCAVTWFERVASHANVADEPCRGVCSRFDEKCRIVIDPDVFIRDLVARSGAGYCMGGKHLRRTPRVKTVLQILNGCCKTEKAILM